MDRATASTRARARIRGEIPVPSGTNTVLVTHSPNTTAAFPDVPTLAQGEVLVLRPDGKGGAQVVGRIKIEEWPGF